MTCKEVASGGYLVYDSTWPRPALLKREDITVLGVPLAKLCNENFNGVRTRILMKNICYAGVLAALLDLDLASIRELLAETYAKKPQLVDSNMKAIQLGYDYARANFTCPLPLRVAPLDKTSGHIMIDGNTAAALGCIFAGATVGAWYPITPSTSLMDAFKSSATACASIRRPASKNFAFIQAEDELAAIGMVIGAMWNGARAFTADHRPRHLADERVPRARLLRRSARGDLRHPARRPLHRHADAHAAVRPPAVRLRLARRHAARAACIPANPEECFYMAVQAFDLAERLQTPVMVLSDLDIGMNDWMCRDLKWDDSYRPDRGKMLSKEEILEAGEVPSLRRQGRRRHHLPHAARACIPRRPTSRAAPATPSSAPTPRTRPNTRWCSTGCWEVGTAEEARAARGHRATAAAARSAWSRSAAAMARSTRPSTCSRHAA